MHSKPHYYSVSNTSIYNCYLFHYLLYRDCENTLGLIRPSRPISFGLLSYGGSLSLVLPGWGLVKSESVSEALSPEKVSTVYVTESPGIMKSDINILRQLSAHQMKGLCQRCVLLKSYIVFKLLTLLQ